MAIKKSQLYAKLWQCCNKLRGGMDASQYKDYILTLLFMKYVSDKAERNPYEVIQVPEGGSFADMVALRGDLRLRGSLLLKAADEAPKGLSIYGQEKDNATYALAWMNMILHDNETAELEHGNTLASLNFDEFSNSVSTEGSYGAR